MQKLKEFISSYQFKDNQEEIHFFKKIKPMFQKELTYFDELFLIEGGRPIGSKKKQKGYYAQCLIAIEVFFSRNHHLYNYYLTDKVHSDETFFLRQSAGLPQQLVYTHDLDRNFSTPYSITLSKLQAFEQLREFLLRAMTLKEPAIQYKETKKKPNITWTDPKSALIELIYGIHAKRSVNSGNITIKQLVDVVEYMFNIRLGNVYPVFIGFGIRKKSRTPYLHSVIDSLEDKLDEKNI
jgi:hypothetical protein